MKKFYLLILTAVFLAVGWEAQAQVYTSILNNPTIPGGPYTLDDGRFWQGGVPPPDNCTGCTITINSDVTMVSDNGTSTSTAYPSPGTPSLSDVKLFGSTLQIVGGVTLTVNTYVEFFDTKLLIGSDPTTAATVILNDQADLNGTSSVRLANINCAINANNDINNPVNGPHPVPHIPDPPAPGIYSIFDPPATPAYSVVLIKPPYVIGTFTQTYGTQYNINCGPPDDINLCSPGWIYGPAETFTDPTYGVIFGPSATLPVQLVQFIASKNPDKTIKLSWATAQEMNSASFDIERSADQGNWDKIGSVKAKGYSSSTSNYTFTDQFPIAGNGYYRLKMIDLDGKFQTSQVILVSSDDIKQPLVIYSNPFSDQIRLKVNVDRAQNLTLVVSDIVGKTYLKQSYNAQVGDNLINLVPNGAASGMFVLHIEGNTYEQTVKLVKQ